MILDMDLDVLDILVLSEYCTRLEICQKIYTTKFSGERILHTENAYIESIFASNKQ